MHTPDESQDTKASESQELRCCCGRLMAIKTSRGLELKCQRCKRVCIVVTGSQDFHYIGEKGKG